MLWMRRTQRDERMSAQGCLLVNRSALAGILNNAGYRLPEKNFVLAAMCKMSGAR